MPGQIERMAHRENPSLVHKKQKEIGKLITAITHELRLKEGQQKHIKVKGRVEMSPSAFRDLHGKLLYGHRVKLLRMEYLDEDTVFLVGRPTYYVYDQSKKRKK